MLNYAGDADYLVTARCYAVRGYYCKLITLMLTLSLTISLNLSLTLTI